MDALHSWGEPQVSGEPCPDARAPEIGRQPHPRALSRRHLRKRVRTWQCKGHCFALQCAHSDLRHPIQLPPEAQKPHHPLKRKGDPRARLGGGQVSVKPVLVSGSKQKLSVYFHFELTEEWREQCRAPWGRLLCPSATSPSFPEHLRLPCCVSCLGLEREGRHPGSARLATPRHPSALIPLRPPVGVAPSHWREVAAHTCRRIAGEGKKELGARSVSRWPCGFLLHGYRAVTKSALPAALWGQGTSQGALTLGTQIPTQTSLREK